MQAFDHQAQHDLEACMSADGSTLSIVGIDVHHTATALAVKSTKPISHCYDLPDNERS